MVQDISVEETVEEYGEEDPGEENLMIQGIRVGGRQLRVWS